MDCDLMADDANAARDFLIDLWPYARPARFLSSKVDSFFLFFTRVILISVCQLITHWCSVMW